MIILNGEAMRTKIGIILLLLMSAFSVGGQSDDSVSKLQIFLMREAVIDSDQITLGDVAMMHGDEESKSKAHKIGLGMLSQPGQVVQIDQATILARLASNGFDLDRVVILGAQIITIKRNELSIDSEELVNTALNYAQKDFSRIGAVKWDVVRKPAGVKLNIEPSNILLVPHMDEKNSDMYCVVIDVVQDKKIIASRSVTFAVQYEVVELVSIRDITAGEMITPSNVKQEKVLSSKKMQIENMYGLMAKNKIASGKKISRSMLKDAAEQIIVKKGQIVEVKYETKYLMVSSLCEVMQDGRVGDMVKVASISMDDKGKVNKKRVIIAKVLEDGTLSAVR